MLHRGMYPVPAPSRAYHPCFTRDSVQAILIVPQGRALVNRKPYPVCLFFWRGRPSTDAPGVQISITQRRRREHLQHLHAGDPISRSPEGRQPSHGSQQRCIVSSAVDRELVGVTAIRGHGVQNRHVFGRYALVDCRIEELRRTKRQLRHHTPARERLGGEARAFRRTVYTVSEVIARRGQHEFRCIRHVEDNGISLCPCQAVKSGTPPHQLNRRQYGAGILSSAFRGRRPVEYPRNTSGVQSPDSKRRIVLLLAEPTRKKPRRQQENVLHYEFSWP